MAWSTSEIFRAFLKDALDNTTAIDLGSDVPKVALYDNDITPDQNAVSASTAYNVGQWVTTGNEVFEAGQWAQAGVVLASMSLDSSVAATVFYDAADTASGTAADLANVFGCLVYDDTLAAVVVDQGICYNYFGGGNSVVNGTFTVVWNANGIFRFTL